MRTNTGYYRDQSKRDRTPTWQWVRNKINKAHTDKDWTDMFLRLPEDKQIECWMKVNPVPKEMKLETEKTSISLIINGIKQVKAIDGTTHKALIGHDPQDDE